MLVLNDSNQSIPFWVHGLTGDKYSKSERNSENYAYSVGCVRIHGTKSVVFSWLLQIEFPWGLFTTSIDSIGSIKAPWDVSVMQYNFIGFNLAVTWRTYKEWLCVRAEVQGC